MKRLPTRGNVDLHFTVGKWTARLLADLAQALDVTQAGILREALDRELERRLRDGGEDIGRRLVDAAAQRRIARALRKVEPGAHRG